MDTAKKQKIIIFIQYFFILLFLFIIGSGNVISPFYGDINMLDEGQYGAWMMHLLNGGHLYKDTYGAYGPFYINPIYFLFNLFPPTVFLIRIVYIVFNVFFAVIIAQFVFRELKIPYYLQLLCIALLLIIPGFGMRQGMGFLSLLLVYKAVTKKQFLWSMLAGTSLAVTFLTSSDIGIFSAVISIFYLSYHAIATKDIKNFLKKVLFIILSYSIIFFLFFLWSSIEGWFYSYINSIFTDLIIYSSIAIPIGRKFPNVFELMPHSFSVLRWIKYLFSQQMLLYWLYFFYVVTFIYFLIRIILKKIKESEQLILLITVFGFFLSTILIGRIDHLIFTLPPVFILFVYFLKNLMITFKQTKIMREKIVSLFICLIIFFFSIRLISIYRPHFGKILAIPSSIAGNKATPEYVGPIAISDAQAKSIKTIQGFVASNTAKEDKIFFFSNTPMLYFLVHKVSPSKYDLPEVANTKEKRMELLQDLKTQKPKYIFYDLNSYAVDGVSNDVRLPEVVAYIKKNYKKTQMDNFIIYMRTSSL